ncbi:MAG TPA: hypothetical protein VK034_00435 [Enhygromyxa sp.]|nr:hypothetical protein [Enhygromyxa sp.]
MLCLAGCEERSLLPGDEAIDFGEGDGDGDPGDGDSGDVDLGDGDGDNTSGDGDGDGTIACAPIVGSLVITDETPPESVVCVERVLGDLTVGPTTGLVDLQLLSSLRRVGGTAYIVGNLALTSVDGLASLDQVEWLHVRRNRNLSDLHGLDSLTDVGRITVTDNDGMTSLAGLPDGLAPTHLEVADNQLLASLDGLPVLLAPGTGPLQIEIDDNPSLIDLGGLSDCCADQAPALTLAGNAKLPDLDGLEAFVRLDSLRLHDNPALATLDGLDNLVEVRTLDIRFDRCLANNHASLVNLLGAPNLTQIDVLQIQWIDSLASLAGLEGVDGLDTLRVRSNEALPWDAVLELAARTEPTTLDACGGVGGPECSSEPCPMF